MRNGHLKEYLLKELERFPVVFVEKPSEDVKDAAHLAKEEVRLTVKDLKAKWSPKDNSANGQDSI